MSKFSDPNEVEMEVFANGGLMLHPNNQPKDDQSNHHQSENGRNNGGFLLKPLDLYSENSIMTIEEENADQLETVH